MVIDSMSRRARSLRHDLPATMRSPVSSLLMTTLLSAVGSAAIAGNVPLKLDERVVTAAQVMARAVSSAPGQAIMPTIVIDE